MQLFLLSFCLFFFCFCFFLSFLFLYLFIFFFVFFFIFLHTVPPNTNDFYICLTQRKNPKSSGQSGPGSTGNEGVLHNSPGLQN